MTEGMVAQESVTPESEAPKVNDYIYTVRYRFTAPDDKSAVDIVKAGLHGKYPAEIKLQQVAKNLPPVKVNIE